MKANSIDWDLLYKELASVNLDSLLKDKSPKEMVDTIIPKIEEAVNLHMKLLDNSKPSGFSSNYIIPKVVRKIFKKKCRLSKQLRSVTSVSRCTNIRDNILRLDVELKHYYEDRQEVLKERLFSKAAENKIFMYTHIKIVQKSLQNWTFSIQRKTCCG